MANAKGNQLCWSIKLILIKLIIIGIIKSWHFSFHSTIKLHDYTKLYCQISTWEVIDDYLLNSNDVPHGDIANPSAVKEAWLVGMTYCIHLGIVALYIDLSLLTLFYGLLCILEKYIKANMLQTQLQNKCNYTV